MTKRELAIVLVDDDTAVPVISKRIVNCTELGMRALCEGVESTAKRAQRRHRAGLALLGLRQRQR